MRKFAMPCAATQSRPILLNNRVKVPVVWVMNHPPLILLLSIPSANNNKITRTTI